jgi:succinate dehydrogenase/fumarate reductase flavoprotein subunit
MSTLQAAALARSTAEAELAEAKERLTGAKESLTNSLEDLVVAGQEASDEAIKKAAEAIVYCRTEIEAKTLADGTGAKALAARVRALNTELRRAVQTGADAKAVEKILDDVETDLKEVKETIRDIKKAQRSAEAELVRLVETTL